ncbi:hypothetical protein Acr_23g0015260 [Actinidia rufa]|uniref:Uncharacterized protein n=1 Tax=Actinidia rufa TaxID=165716 RepID=A0A7J0GQT4_9ERIC|nr:hypothetical protein Acr_23g0015260 [Actinidia rufa]
MRNHVGEDGEKTSHSQIPTTETAVMEAATMVHGDKDEHHRRCFGRQRGTAMSLAFARANGDNVWQMRPKGAWVGAGVES